MSQNYKNDSLLRQRQPSNGKNAITIHNLGEAGNAKVISILAKRLSEVEEQLSNVKKQLNVALHSIAAKDGELKDIKKKLSLGENLQPQKNSIKSGGSNKSQSSAETSVEPASTARSPKKTSVNSASSVESLNPKRDDGQLKIDKIDSSDSKISGEISETSGQTTASSKEILIEENKKLSQKLNEIERFLGDYGLIWVGEDAIKNKNGQKKFSEIRTKTTIKIKPNFDKVLTVIDELNIGASEPHVVKSANEAKFENCTVLNLKLYADGMQLENNPFRKYDTPSARDFFKDLEDGYFPTELKDKHPEGVIFKVDDKRNINFEDDKNSQKTPVAFSGNGHRLGSGSENSVKHKSKEHRKVSDKRSSKEAEEIKNDKQININNIIINTLNDEKRKDRELYGDLSEKLFHKETKNMKVNSDPLNLRDSIQTNEGNKKYEQTMVAKKTQSKKSLVKDNSDSSETLEYESPGVKLKLERRGRADRNARGFGSGSDDLQTRWESDQEPQISTPAIEQLKKKKKLKDVTLPSIPASLNIQSIDGSDTLGNVKGGGSSKSKTDEDYKYAPINITNISYHEAPVTFQNPNNDHERLGKSNSNTSNTSKNNQKNQDERDFSVLKYKGRTEYEEKYVQGAMNIEKLLLEKAENKEENHEQKHFDPNQKFQNFVYLGNRDQLNETKIETEEISSENEEDKDKLNDIQSNVTEAESDINEKRTSEIEITEMAQTMLEESGNFKHLSQENLQDSETIKSPVSENSIQDQISETESL